MSVETPPAPATTTACPRCGAPMGPDQEWCLSCGAAATTRIAPPPSWKAPVAVVAAVLLIAAGALGLAFLELSDDAERVARTPAASPTPTPAASAIPETSPSPAPSPTPSGETSPVPTPDEEASPTPSPSGGSGTATSWPAGKTAWTVVLLSASSKAEADKRAQELTSQGISAGVLKSDDYSSLRRGYWVVFSGRYSSSDDAQQAAEGMGAKAAGSYVRYVKPR